MTASFKTFDEDFAELSERDGLIPASYLARYKWVHVDTISRFTKKEWHKYLEDAYNQVTIKLPSVTKKAMKHKIITIIHPKH